jgi:hypothetical protein
VRAWFCLAVAAIAASIADPIVEGASNSGWFGPGKFTDHSTWDVIPTLVVGLVFVLWHSYLRIRQALDGPDQKMRGFGSLNLTVAIKLLPIIFVLQLGILYGMESLEQKIVWGHVLGGTIWLGGPVLISASVHALASAGVALVAAVCIRAFADGAVRLAHLVETFARLAPDRSRSVFDPRLLPGWLPRDVAVARIWSGRAPPSSLRSFPTRPHRVGR